MQAETREGFARDYSKAPDRLIRLEEVKDIVGLGKTMIYRLERDGRFPRRCKPGGHATRWSEAEVVAWKEAQLAERRAA